MSANPTAEDLIRRLRVQAHGPDLEAAEWIEAHAEDGERLDRIRRKLDEMGTRGRRRPGGRRDVSKGVKAVAAERRRQIASEGFDAEHDDQHGIGTMAAAAACYAAHCYDAADSELLADWFGETWPWDLEWWKPGGESLENSARRLVKAGALIAAELDRMARMGVKF